MHEIILFDPQTANSMVTCVRNSGEDLYNAKLQHSTSIYFELKFCAAWDGGTPLPFD